jgi:hypothetical protein
MTLLQMLALSLAVAVGLYLLVALLLPEKLQ